MEPETFDEATHSLLEAIANQDHEIYVRHSRAHGALCPDIGQRAIINQYSLSLNSTEDYATAFESLINALSGICLVYIQKKQKEGKLNLVNWDHDDGSEQWRLIEVSAGLDSGHYNLKGNPLNKEISISTESKDLEQLFFIFMNHWDKNLNYDVLVQPGEKDELELESEHKKPNFFLSLFKKKAEVITPEEKPYIPISAWQPPEIYTHQYECEGFSIEIHFGGIDTDEPETKRELLD